MRRFRKYKILMAGLALALTLILGGCQSQTAALQQEMQTGEIIETTVGEESTDETIRLEEVSSEEVETETVSETETEDIYQDASAWTSAANGEEETEDLDKYKEKISEETAGASADNYYTDPIPEGKQEPVEPQDVTVDKSKAKTCTLSVECSTILNNMDDLTEGKESLVPSDGVIFKTKKVTFYEGESVFDVLKREMQNNRIHMESEFTAMYNSAYVQGINNLYEFDCGSLSGWMYCVNDWYPNYGCSRYQVKAGDVIEWHYTCDLGRDLGQTWVD